MSKKRIFIDGAEGTTGIDIKERLTAWNNETSAGVEVIALPDELRKDKKHRKLNLNDCDVAVLCLPDDAAREAVAMVDNPAVKNFGLFDRAPRPATGGFMVCPNTTNSNQPLLVNHHGSATPVVTRLVLFCWSRR